MARREMTFWNESGEFVQLVASDRDLFGDTLIDVEINRGGHQDGFTLTMTEMENLFTLLSV